MTPDDYITIMDAALAAETGVRLTFDDPAAAKRVRQRIYNLRRALWFRKHPRYAEFADLTMHCPPTAPGELWIIPRRCFYCRNDTIDASFGLAPLPSDRIGDIYRHRNFTRS